MTSSQGEPAQSFGDPETAYDVLFVTSAYTPAVDYGGPVSTIAVLASALAAEGHRLSVLTSDFGFNRSHVAPGTRSVDNLPVTYVRRILSRGWTSVPGVLPRSIMDSRRPDVVHCFGLRDPFVTAIAGRAMRLGIPVVLEPMGMAVPRVRSERLKQLFDVSAGRRVTRGASAVVATSSLEQAELSELGYDRVVLRPNPIRMPESVVRRNPQFDLCYVGRIHQKKQLHLIVEAVGRTSLTALIAGPAEDGSLAELTAVAERLGVASRITFRGWVSPAERARIFSESRCFVMPSLTENFGNVAAEAMAAGLPAVVSDMCGVAEYVNQGAGLVVEPNLESFVAGIERLFSDESHLLATGRRATEVVEPVTPERVARTQSRIYQAVVGA